jgi:DNA recombination protein RmuC
MASGVILAFFLGGILEWLLSRRQAGRLRQELQETLVARERAEERARRLPQLEAQLAELQSEKVTWHEKLAGLSSFHEAQAEKLAWLDQAREILRQDFKALSGQVLSDNAQEFLGRARDSLSANLATHKAELKTLMQPLDLALKALEAQVRDLEGKREGAYGELRTTLAQVQQLHQNLQSETARLSHALRAGTQQRGRWAEFQLQRLVEMAGLQKQVDFELQPGAGERRPDMLVHLPRGGSVAVDAKALVTRYLEALEVAQEEGRQKKLLEHAKGVRHHIEHLSQREYWRKLPETPELVVMYLPSDASLIAALEYSPDLLEFAFQRRIVLAAPTTLFALLKAIAAGWQQYEVTANAQQIFSLGKEFYHRLQKFSDHFAGLGKALEQAVSRFNEAVGSFENRLIPAARRFQELGVAAEEPTPLKPVESQPRLTVSSEPSAVNREP